MAAGASVTWTHCSVLFEVTWGKTRCIRADAHVRTDASPSPPLPSPSLPPSLPSPLSLLPSADRADANFFIFLKIILFYLIFFKLFFGSCCRLGKKEFFFNFQFSLFASQSPNSPNSPSSTGFAGEAARRRRFFRPSSPSHPSKLYSSLGWLNSKVPKPFPPFSLRLIDVDGF
jgi:hypothetical protein